MSQNNYRIRKATQFDLGGIKTLADKHKHELGFVLRPALVRSIAHGQVFIATTDTELIGSVDYHHRRDTQTTLYHIVVAQEWRRQGIGRGLIESLQNEASAQGKKRILLKCPEDLSANSFYQQLGFKLLSVANGRSRKLNVWQLAIGD